MGIKHARQGAGAPEGGQGAFIWTQGAADILRKAIRPNRRVVLHCADDQRILRRQIDGSLGFATTGAVVAPVAKG